MKLLKEMHSEAETASVIAQSAKPSERYMQVSRSTAYVHAPGQLSCCAGFSGISVVPARTGGERAEFCHNDNNNTDLLYSQDM